jgi:hypothetical protein
LKGKKKDEKMEKRIRGSEANEVEGRKEVSGMKGWGKGE